jgi:hypothetical protein
VVGGKNAGFLRQAAPGNLNNQGHGWRIRDCPVLIGFVDRYTPSGKVVVEEKGFGSTGRGKNAKGESEVEAGRTCRGGTREA